MPTGPMAWEQPWQPPEDGDRIHMADWSAWWQEVLDTDWATERSIQYACGPEYLMYEEIVTFGAETAKGVWP